MKEINYLREEIRRRRNAKKLTQEALAELADLSLGAIKQVELGRNEPSVKTLIKIAHALGVTTDELLHGPRGGVESRRASDQHLDTTALAAAANVLDALSKLPHPHIDVAMAWIFRDLSFLDEYPELAESYRTNIKGL